MPDQVTPGNNTFLNDSHRNDSNRAECSTDRYNAVCEPAFEKIGVKLDVIMNKLFIDNGGESYQSRLNRHDRWIRSVMYILGVVAVAVVGILTDLVIKAL